MAEQWESRQRGVILVYKIRGGSTLNAPFEERTRLRLIYLGDGDIWMSEVENRFELD